LRKDGSIGTTGKENHFGNGGTGEDLYVKVEVVFREGARREKKGIWNNRCQAGGMMCEGVPHWGGGGGVHGKMNKVVLW